MLLVIVNDQIVLQSLDETEARRAAESAASTGVSAILARVVATCIAKPVPVAEWVEAA